LSSILRALKKLDEDAASPESQGEKHQKTMRQVVHRRTRPSLAKNRLFFIVPALVLVIGVVWIVLNSKQEPGIVKKQEPLPEKKVDARLPQKDEPVQPLQSIHPAQPDQPEKQVPVVKQDLNETKKEKKQEMQEELKPVEQVEPSPKPQMPVNRPPTQPVTEKKKTAPGWKVLSPLSAQRPKPSEGLTPKAQAGKIQLVLDGILWSSIPARRVALINDRYLKEGDKIKGVTVVKIEREKVTLRSGRETWTIQLKKQ
jgi:hypothetical protein